MNQTDGQRWPAQWASEPFLYLTTRGRRSGRPHQIEIWFAAHDGRALPACRPNTADRLDIA